MNKKIFFIFSIFLILFASCANAIVVQDLEDIQEGTTQVIESNAKIQSELGQLREEVNRQRLVIDELNAKVLTQDDVGIIGYNVNIAMAEWQRQFLIMFLAILMFGFAVFAVFKSKGWF